MKRNHSNLLIALLFFGGFCVLAYPTFSQFYNKQLAKQAVNAYQSQLEQFSDTQYEDMFTDARHFNSRLYGRDSELFDTVAYNNTLNLGNGMMGYIEIPKINVSLPIYHGTTESVLQKGVGHLEWTALPTGDLGNNTVLTGHTGLPSAKLFTDVDQLGMGDVMLLKILDEVFYYEVNDINVVEPHEVDKISSSTTKDLITLVTCTPYGINSHRLLVQGERLYISDYEKEEYNFGEKNTVMIVMERLMLVVMLAMAGWFFYRWRKQVYIPPPIDLDP